MYGAAFGTCSYPMCVSPALHLMRWYDVTGVVTGGSCGSHKSNAKDLDLISIEDATDEAVERFEASYPQRVAL
jgi:purine-nucleoside phosphorylase